MARLSLRTQEPAPHLNSHNPTRKTNRGMTSMDLDNELELENYSSSSMNTAGKNRPEISKTDPKVKWQ